MSLFQLFNGHLNLKQVITEEDLLDSDETSPRWMKYSYAMIPWPVTIATMEGFLDTRPILRWLTWKPLALADRSFTYANTRPSYDSSGAQNCDCIDF